MSIKRIVAAIGKEMDQIAGGGGSGWNESWGQEVIHQEILPRVKPGDKVLDLGGGSGRASMPLAARGAKVLIVDNDDRAIEFGREKRQNAGLNKNVRTVEMDVRNIQRRAVGGGSDVVLASDVVNHMSKEDANNLIDSLPRLLKQGKGGIVYVNGPSTESWLFNNPEWGGAEVVDDSTLKVMCDCSGELKEELLPFFQPGEIATRLAMKGANIIRSQTIERGDNALLEEVVARFSPRRKNTN